MVVADALNCQKETATFIVEGKVDYLLNIKDNHPTLKEEIETYVQDEILQAEMGKTMKIEKNRERMEAVDLYWCYQN